MTNLCTVMSELQTDVSGLMDTIKDKYIMSLESIKNILDVITALTKY